MSSMANSWNGRLYSVKRFQSAQALQDQLELELLVLRFLDPAGDVLEVDEHGQLAFSVHLFSRGP